MQICFAGGTAKKKPNSQGVRPTEEGGNDCRHCAALLVFQSTDRKSFCAPFSGSLWPPLPKIGFRAAGYFGIFLSQTLLFSESPIARAKDICGRMATVNFILPLYKAIGGDRKSNLQRLCNRGYHQSSLANLIIFSNPQGSGTRNDRTAKRGLLPTPQLSRQLEGPAQSGRSPHSLRPVTLGRGPRFAGAASSFSSLLSVSSYASKRRARIRFQTPPAATARPFVRPLLLAKKASLARLLLQFLARRQSRPGAIPSAYGLRDEAAWRLRLSVTPPRATLHTLEKRSASLH